MSQITSQELALLRSRTHSTKLWLSIYKPNTVLACRVNNASAAKGDRVITYDGGSGDYLDINSGMTMYIGTSAGKWDIGRIRVRSATSSTITVAENSHIAWQDDLYLTVVDFYEVWPVYPFYELNGGVVTWYKDYDITYTNQNSVLGTIINMGNHKALWAGDTVDYSSTGSTTVTGEGVSYYWEFGGGNPSTSVDAHPGTVTYDTPGHYTTSLSVTGSSVSDISYRHISVYDKPNEGVETPILGWQLNNLSGGRSDGGWVASIRVWEDIDDVVPGALVVIYSDTMYGNTEQSVNGKTVFVGYIDDNTIRYDYQTSSVDFDAISITNVMKNQEAPIVSLESVASPTDWYEIDDMTITKFLYHYLRWHSTLLNVADIRYLDTNWFFQYQDTDPSSLYDVLHNFMFNSLRGAVISDRKGKIWCEISPEGLPDALNALPVGMTIDKQDWVGTPDIQERMTNPMSYIEMGGVGWSGISTGTWNAYLAAAPGDEVHSYYGKEGDFQGLILSDQAQLNALVGDVYAYNNATYPSVNLGLAGNYNNLDIAPRETQKLIISSDDNNRGITFNGKKFHIINMSWLYDPVNEIFLPQITLHEVTDGQDGVTVIIPPEQLENYGFEPDIFTPDFEPFPMIPIGNIGFPSPYMPPYDEPLSPTSCCSDLNLPPTDLYYPVGFTLRSDDLLFFNSSAPRYLTLRTFLHTHSSYIWLVGKFEQSNDAGVSWTELEDNTVWRVYLASQLGGVVEASVDKETGESNGRGKAFYESVCKGMYASEVRVTLNSCSTGGGGLTLSAEDAKVIFDDGNAYAGFSGLILNTYNADTTTSIVDGLFALNGSGSYANGQLKLTVRCIQVTGSSSVIVGVVGRDYWPEFSPNVGGNTTPTQVIATGESYEILGQAGLAFPSGSIHYFGIDVRCASPNGAYTAQLEVTDAKWVVGATEYDLYSSTCTDINRLTIEGIHIRNTC